MSSQQQEYPALLAALEPEEAVSVLNSRVVLITQTNTNIADFLEERRRIEQRYASELRKLARKPQHDATSSLGIFQMPWQRIISGLENLAQSHETLASKIQADVEIPLRQFTSNSKELEKISTSQGNITALARDVTKAKDKVGKLNAKGSKKIDGANSEVEDAMRMWESQSPSTFTQLQALDETRIEHLRSLLTQFQTDEADQIERNRASAESCLNALLNIETADEIRTFAEKVQQGNIIIPRRLSTAANTIRPSSSSNVPPVPPPPRSQDPRHKASASGDRVPALPEQTPQKSKMGGLKRLGTVMRRKSAAPPPPTSLADKKKEKRSIIPFRRGDSSRSFQDLEESGRDLTPIQSRTGQGEPRQSTVSSEAAAHNETTLAPETQDVPNGLGELHKSSSDALPPPLQPTPAQGLGPQPAGTDQSVPTILTSESINDPFALANDGEDTARNLKIRDQPIQEDASEAQIAMSNMANQLRLQAQNSGLTRAGGSMRGRRDVRNTVFVAGNQDISGSTANYNGGLSPPVEASITTAESPVQAASSSPVNNTPDLSVTAKRTTIPGTLGDDHMTTSDTNSIHSATSLAVGAHHPELHSPGLSASIVETINTWFSDTGVTKSYVIGEVAFSHTTSPLSTPQDSDTIRLKNFQSLEKVASNPTFVSSYKPPSGEMTADEQAGTYTVSLSPIRRSMPTVGLKYQLHLNDSNLAQYSPILITPAWRIIAGQANVIVFYSRNPAFRPDLSATSTGSEVILKNVAISVILNVKDAAAGKPVSAMMAPNTGATFRRKAGAVTWKLPELKLKVAPDPESGAEQDRLLVRFITEGEQLAKQGGIEVKFEMPDTTAGNLGVERLNDHTATVSSAIASTVNDPFADSEPTTGANNSGGGWTEIPTKRLLISGRYSTA